jgi:hypothetical protein
LLLLTPPAPYRIEGCVKEKYADEMADLAEMDLVRGEHHASEVHDAVRNATPESRAAFEAAYGSIARELHIIAPPEDGAWVEVWRLLEDGTVAHHRHEGGSEEAERILEAARHPRAGASLTTPIGGRL